MASQMIECYQFNSQWMNLLLSFTKHLPFSLLAKNLEKESFEAQSLNHPGIFKSADADDP